MTAVEHARHELLRRRIGGGASSLGNARDFNTDQGAQFTAKQWIDVLQKHDVKISMDGKGRCLDNVFVERLWRAVKYEEIFLHAYDDLVEARVHLRRYFRAAPPARR